MNEGPDRPNALRQLNDVLVKEGFEAFYAKDKHCYLRHVGTRTVTVPQANPHRPLSMRGMSDADNAGVLALGGAWGWSMGLNFGRLRVAGSIPATPTQNVQVRVHIDLD
jgi:hypothetical protein